MNYPPFSCVPSFLRNATCLSLIILPLVLSYAFYQSVPVFLNLSSTANACFLLFFSPNLCFFLFTIQIREILQQLNRNRQSLFFSATWPREVQSLANEFLKDAVQINIGDQGVLNANKAITQHIMCLENYEKESTVTALLNKLNKAADKNPNNVPKTIIFVARKSDCDILSNTLYR